MKVELQEKIMNSIESLRKKIDLIDSRIIRLLHQRYDAVIKMADYKQKKRLSLLQKRREKEILINIKKSIGNKQKSIVFIENIFKEILKESKKAQKNLYERLQKTKNLIK